MRLATRGHSPTGRQSTPDRQRARLTGYAGSWIVDPDHLRADPPAALQTPARQQAEAEPGDRAQQRTRIAPETHDTCDGAGQQTCPGQSMHQQRCVKDLSILQRNRHQVSRPMAA